MHISLIIATFNRPIDLKRCLDSVLRLVNDECFDEVIIVEQGDIARTKVIAKSYHSRINIKTYYSSILSASRARNLGIKKCSGNFIFFIDDDTELSDDYVKVAYQYFKEHSHVMGLTGPINYIQPKQNRPLSRLIRYRYIFKCYVNIFLEILLMNRYNFIKMSISPSGANSHLFPFSLKKYEHNIEWIQGCHMAFRRTVFEAGFRFNPNFICWSLGEDAMMTYQIYKHYGKGSLRYLPGFRITHHSSKEISANIEEIIKMQVIYRFIFWYKEVYRNSLYNLICYLYGQLGYIRSLCIDYGLRKCFKVLPSAYLYLYKNWKAIGANSIDYNSFIIK